MLIIRWLARLTTAQFICLAVAVGAVVAAGAGIGVAALVDRFGWRAAPLLAVVLIAAVVGIAALLGKIRDIESGEGDG